MYLVFEQLLIMKQQIVMKICKICGEETDNPVGVCDECKFSVIDLEGISPNM
jgi:hypothetical protein